MRKYFNRRVIILSSILAFGFIFIGLQFAHSLAAWSLLAFPFLLVWSLPIVYWSKDRRSRSRYDVPYLIGTFLSMGLLSFLFVFTLAEVVFALGIHQLDAHHLGLTNTLPTSMTNSTLLNESQWPTIAILLSILALIVGVIRAIIGPRVRLVPVPYEKLSPSLSGLKIVQISDLHVGPTVGARYVKKVAKKILAIKPDLIALTGDLVDGTPEELNADLAPLYELAKTFPIFYVTGNHEYYWGARAWIDEFKKNGITVLENSNTWFEHHGQKILIGGVVDYAAALYENPKVEPDPIQASKGKEDAQLRILLAHQPQISTQAEQAGFDLLLVGHTHAGQFFPWTFVIRFFHKFYSGLHKFKNLWIYVSPGTGYWGPPIRLGSTSEITLLELKKV